MEIREDVPLAPMTTIGVGGPARFFASARSTDDLREAVDWSRSRRTRLFILGGGSNVVISDAGFDGLVVRADLRGITVETTGDVATVRVAAGERWDDFVEYAVRRGWAGVECLSGIPGSTGATPIQNVGAYGQEVSETITHVEVLDRREGVVRTLTNPECGFVYRGSLFKNVERERYIVAAVSFRLTVGGTAAVRYPELERTLLERGVHADDLIGVREAVITIRQRKGMVLDPADPDTRSDGSFFMNPVLTPGEYAAFLERLGDGEQPTAFAGPDGRVKIPAAWLIEHAGFAKGYAHGRAALSTKHCLAITNRGGATALEITELAGQIRERVRERFALELLPEPSFVGF